MLDMRAVSDGFHYLNLQPVGQSGTLGTPRLYPFIKLPQTQGVDHMTCLCIIDDQVLFAQELNTKKDYGTVAIIIVK